MRILIVEDEFGTRNGICRALDTHFKGCHDLLTAENGEQGIKMMSEQAVDLVITDIRMPGMNGIEMLERAIKQLSFTITSILLTGYAEFEYAKAGLKLGATNYLLKPIDIDDLIAAVEEGLTLSRERRISQLSVRLYGDKVSGSGMELSPDNLSIEKACTYIQENIAENINVKEVADHVHLSASYFSVLFKNVKGVTFSEYLTRTRHRLAKELLLTTEYDVSFIAEKTGYRSASYFIKVFKELEKITPKQFREQLTRKLR